jgi:hypothetical protein
MTTKSSPYDRCIRDCAECAMICAKCAHHCLGMGGEHAGQEHQCVMRDCAEICALAVAFMMRESRHAEHLCGECADVCRSCAESCDSLADGDEMMTRCADICRRCAESCKQMSGSAQRR